MSNIDGIVKWATNLLFVENTKQSCPKVYRSILLIHTSTDKHVFDARNLILELSQRQKGESFTDTLIMAQLQETYDILLGGV